jgi:SAM-dependent methyltransferase
MKFSLPEEFDAEIYRASYPELASFDEFELRNHYIRFGISEGRTPNSIRDRIDFALLIDKDWETLEIGPWAAPLVRGPKVRYADVLDSDELRKRARDHGMIPTGVPDIEWVIQPNDLSSIMGEFDCVVSSHLIEHQPDLISHLKSVSRLLREGGQYFLVIPDRRFCFDRFLASSNIAQVVGAHVDQREVHSLESLLQHRALLAHNDALRHWSGDHGGPMTDRIDLMFAALQEFHYTNGGYIDVHAWFFEPETWTSLMDDLVALRFSDLAVDRTYGTRYGQFEFFAVLRKQQSG